MALSRTMAQKDMDTFLTEIGATDNTFRRYENAERRKQAKGRLRALERLRHGRSETSAGSHRAYSAVYTPKMVL